MIHLLRYRKPVIIILLTMLLASCNTNFHQAETDFANVNHKDSWLHHPVFGDPSWDSFIHDPVNPIIQGTRDAEWPVNGFLFYDPVSGCEYIYAPATSVSLNRNYQAIFRYPIENAHIPSSRELWKEGSIWHSLPRVQEYEGIWGQTISGYVDKTGTFRVLFPSLNKNDLGTINTASRSWTHAYREQGFFLSGHKAPSISYIHQECKKPVLNIGLKYTGKFSVIFDALSPLGPDAPSANNKIHPLLFSDQKRIEIKDNHWELIHSDRINQSTIIASGEFIQADSCKIGLDFKGKQRYLMINGAEVWAGNKMSNWKEVKNDTLFTYGIGAEASIPGSRVKLNFTGSSFSVYSPLKPGYGKIKLTIDGDSEVILNARSLNPGKSRPLYRSKQLPKGNHAVVMELMEGIMPVDCIRVY